LRAWPSESWKGRLGTRGIVGAMGNAYLGKSRAGLSRDQKEWGILMTSGTGVCGLLLDDPFCFPSCLRVPEAWVYICQ
jgi:hypothetical protein